LSVTTAKTLIGIVVLIVAVIAIWRADGWKHRMQLVALVMAGVFLPAAFSDWMTNLPAQGFSTAFGWAANLIS